MDSSKALLFPSRSDGLTILEQVQKTTPESLVCETPKRPYLVAMNQHYKLLVLFRPRCKLWSCPACSETNKNLWAVRVYQGASNLTANGHDISFLTLTSHERTNKQTSLKIWPKAWKKLRERASYAASGFQYVLIPEQHKDGRLHVHALETANLGKRFWKDNARECGLGFIADEQIARTAGGAAIYVTKYLTKSIAYQEWPKGFRRIRTSRQWPKLTREELQGWNFETLPQHAALSDLCAEWKEDGYTIYQENHKAAWEFIQKIQGYIDTLEGESE